MNIPRMPFLGDISQLRGQQKYGDGLPFVSYIMQAHAVPESEKVVAGIVTRLIDEGGARLICVESGFSNHDASEIRALLPETLDDDGRKQAALRLIEQGRINGPEYVAMTSDRQFVLAGVDDQVLYQKMRDAIKPLLRDGPRWSTLIGTLRSELHSQSDNTLPPELARFLEQRRQFESSHDFVTHFGMLREYIERLELDMTPMRNLQALLETIDIERAIDFEQANIEQTQIVEQIIDLISSPAALMQYSLNKIEWDLSDGSIEEQLQRISSLSADEMREFDRRYNKTPAGRLIQYALIEQGITTMPTDPMEVITQFMKGFQEVSTETIKVLQSMQEEKINQLDFIDYLLDLMALFGIDHSKGQNLIKFAHYLHRFHAANLADLLTEMQFMEDLVVNKLLENAGSLRASTYVNLDKRLILLSDLLNAALLHDGVFSVQKQIRLLQHSALGAELESFIGNTESLQMFQGLSDDYEKIFRAGMDFYKVVKERANKLVENTMKCMREGGYDQAVLLTGGLYQNQVEAKFSENQISYQVMLPGSYNVANGVNWTNTINSGRDIYRDLMSGN